MNKILSAILFVLPLNVSSQHLFNQTTKEAGLMISSNGQMNALSLSINQYWGIGHKRQLIKIGLGARLTSTLGNNSLLYITAPAKITSGKTGPSVFFAPNIPENIDTLQIKNTQINSLNAYLALRYDFNKKWGAEFNIDLAGISIGSKKSATLDYGEQSNLKKTTDAKPTTGNLLLISDNDKGSLNSELIISYLYSSRFKFKAGASFLFNEYTISNPASYTNSLGNNINTDRYRTKALIFGLGMNYLLKNNKHH